MKNFSKKEDHCRAAKKASMLLKEGVGISQILISTYRDYGTLNKLGDNNFYKKNN